MANDPLHAGTGETLAIATASDGAVWVEGENKLARLAPDGTFTSFAYRAGQDLGDPSLAAGPDGSVDFIDPGSTYLTFTSTSVVTNDSTPPSIGRITPDGTVTKVVVLGGTPTDLTSEADGSVDFLLTKADGSAAIDHLGFDGTIAEHPLASGLANPSDLTVGPDGALWFLNDSTDVFSGGPTTSEVGRLDASGTVTSFPFTVPAIQGSGSLFPGGLISAPDGNLYFLENDAVARVTKAGVVSTTAVSMPFLSLVDTIGPNGQLWLAVEDTPEFQDGVARFAFGETGAGAGGPSGSTNSNPPLLSLNSGGHTPPVAVTLAPSSGATPLVKVASPQAPAVVTPLSPAKAPALPTTTKLLPTTATASPESLIPIVGEPITSGPDAATTDVGSFTFAVIGQRPKSSIGTSRIGDQARPTA